MREKAFFFLLRFRISFSMLRFARVSGSWFKLQDRNSTYLSGHQMKLRFLRTQMNGGEKLNKLVLLKQ